MEAPFDIKLKSFLKKIKDPQKRRAIQLLFLSDREFANLSELTIQRVSEDANQSKIAN